MFRYSNGKFLFLKGNANLVLKSLELFRQYLMKLSSVQNLFSNEMKTNFKSHAHRMATMDFRTF